MVVALGPALLVVLVSLSLVVLILGRGAGVT